MFSSTFKIAKKKVGLDQLTYFIVDNAANHDGDIEISKFELSGDRKEKLKRIELLGITLLLDFMSKGFQPIPLDGEGTPCKKRNPEDSEITLEEIKNNSSPKLHK